MFGIKGEVESFVRELIRDEEQREYFFQIAKKQPLIGDKVRVKDFDDAHDGLIGRIVDVDSDPEYVGVLKKLEYTVELEKLGSLPISRLHYWHLEVLEESDPFKTDTPEQRAFDFLMLHDRETMRKFFEEQFFKFVEENLSGGDLLESEKEDALKILLRLSKGE